MTLVVDTNAGPDATTEDGAGGGDGATADTAPGDDGGDDADGAGPPDDTPGPLDDTSAPKGYVAAFVVESAEDLGPAGPYTGARVGDIVIENDHVRFVVRASSDQALYIQNLGGGMVMDAALKGADADDLLFETGPLLGLESLGKGTVQVTRDGSDGTAEITVTATTAYIPTIDAFVPSFDDPIQATDTYRLGPDDRGLELRLRHAGNGPIQIGQAIFASGLLEFGPDVKAPFLVTSGPHVSYAIASAGDLVRGGFAGLELLFGTEVEPGVDWVRWLLVGDGSLSSVVDQVLERRGTPYGTVSGTVSGGPEVRVEARDAEGVVVTRMRPDAAGAFSGRLPVGLWSLVPVTAAGPEGAPASVDVVEGQTVDGLSLSAAPAATLTVTLTDPTRLTLIGPGGKLDRPLPPGTHPLRLAPGSWAITATRGFEYEIDQTAMDLAAGAEEAWTPVLVRSVDTTGWIGSDFHLHSEWSTDSNVPLPERVIACAAEGVEYAVATDHDVVTDYRPAIPASVAGRIVVAQGVESSTGLKGHFNAWPLAIDANLPGRGAPIWAHLDFAGIMNALGAGTPGRVVQVNHPRNATSAALDALGFDADDPDPSHLAVFTFNAIEVYNDTSEVELVLHDWMTLVEAGLPITATGVSDSHTIGAYCGQARTYVEVADDDPATAKATDIDAGVLARRTLVSSGPFATLVKVQSGVVHLRVQAPSWMPVDRIRLFVNGVMDTELPVPPTTDVVRYDADITLTNASGTWVVAVVDAVAVPSPMLKKKALAVTPVTWMQ